MKSHVSDLTEVAVSVLKDIAAQCTANQLDLRDVKTITSRVKHEGLSFLTITLPTLGADLEQALSLGSIAPTHFRGFRKRGKAPAFLQAVFAQVFDLSTGGLHAEPCVTAIGCIRQIAYTFKKLQVDCHPVRVRKTLTKFTTCEHIFEEAIATDDVSDFRNVSRCLWDTVFAGGSLPPVFDTVPKHGPGATSDKLTGNAKYKLDRWHDRLEPYFPLLATVFSTENAVDSEAFENVSVVLSEEEQSVKITPVPKTLKGPRIIAIEPTCMQYTQQALSRALVTLLERHPFTRGHVNFTDQRCNRYLAIMSSADRKLATLDMSAASDRVPYSLAVSMFSSVPDFQGAVIASRSKTAQMPNGDVIRLKKFASMGSALCFPVEAMYFYTLCIGALLKKHNLPVTPPNIYKMSRDVYVYGDDILVPTDDAEMVADYLQKYYCKVNMSKSFWTGKFRESCGMDAYDGQEVTPTYLRRLPPSNQREPEALISWIKTSNLLYQKGYWLTASHLMKRCESILGKLPVVGPECAGLGKVSFQRYVSAERWNRRYQVHEVKTWIASPVYRTDKLDGYPALTKCLLSLEAPLSPGAVKDKKHLLRSARHGAVVLKRRWTRPY